MRQKEELSDKEAMDIAFVSKFISKEYAPQVVETMSKLFNDAIINDRLLKIDVGVILGGMILKNILDEDKQNKLLGMINMKHIKSEIEKIVYDEFGDELDAKDDEIDKLNKSNSQFRDKAKKLKELDDLNTPQAKKILESMLLL